MKGRDKKKQDLQGMRRKGEQGKREGHGRGRQEEEVGGRGTVFQEGLSVAALTSMAVVSQVTCL